MRPFDPRSWNLLMPASVLALTACGHGPADEAADDSTDTTDSSMTTVSSVTSVSTYTTYTTYTTTYTSYTTYSYDPCNYCQPNELCNGNYCYTPECLTNADCARGQVCTDHVCGPIPESIYCGVWPTTTIDIPSVSGVIDLTFVDVDADNIDELVLLTADGVSVVDDDLTVTDTAWVMPGMFTNVVGLRVDGDTTLDLAFTNSGLAGLRTLIGNGDGSFGGESDDDVEPLIDPIAVDPNGDGQDELVGLLAGVPTIVMGVGEMPVVSDLGVSDMFQHLDHGDNDTDGQRDLLMAGVVGDPMLMSSTWLLQQSGAWGVADTHMNLTLDGPSMWAALDLDGDGVDNAFAIADGMGGSVLQSWSGMVPALATVPEAGILWLVGAEFDGTNGEELLLGGTNPRVVQRLNANPIGCTYPLMGFPSGGSKAVAGDFDGDGIDEVAVLGNGVVNVRENNF